MNDDERFDGLYLNVASTTRGIEPLLDTVFSFLRRKTDFFAGPPGSGEQGTEKAIEKVNEVLQKHAALYRKSQSQVTKKAATAKKVKAKVDPPKPKKTVEEEEVIEIGSDGKFDASEPSESSKNVTLPKKNAQEETKKEETETAEKKDDEEARGPPPPGNGGTVDGKYVWTQILSELVVTVPVPENTRGRDLDVIISKNRLKVALRSDAKQPIIDAPFTKAVICDDSFWTVEDGNRLVLNLQKLNQMEWWESLCEGDPKVDVKAIQPESSSLSDLDGETRKTVEKMMYDQRQKAMGKPSSDEEQKLSVLENFKKQHPELDFSNAKVT